MPKFLYSNLQQIVQMAFGLLYFDHLNKYKEFQPPDIYKLQSEGPRRVYLFP